MKDIIKKALCLAAVAALLVSGVPKVGAEEVVTPSYSGGIRHQNLEFIGAKHGWILASTTAKLIASGNGVLYAICPTGGTLGKYSLAFDTTGIGQIASPDDISLGYGLSPRVPVLDSAGSGFGVNDGCWVPRVPAQFTGGLVGIQNDNGHSTLYLYRLTGGSVTTNP